jgi:hypothetical protein
MLGILANTDFATVCLSASSLKNCVAFHFSLFALLEYGFASDLLNVEPSSLLNILYAICFLGTICPLPFIQMLPSVNSNPINVDFFACQPGTVQFGGSNFIHIDCWNTAQAFTAVHRIGLEISSSAFPKYDRNLNTGAPLGFTEEMAVAEQHIYHDEAYPSAVVLPIILRLSNPPCNNPALTYCDMGGVPFFVLV